MRLAALVTAAALPLAAAAQDGLEAGRAEYMTACAICHGESGKGAGPYSEFLTLEVPSLTGLAEANGGEFPYLDVYLVIDGRGGVRAHGESMPIWGTRYTEAAQEDFGIYGAEIVAQGRISVLVNYIASIQE
jgi:mono/diheme cytochrome c family protein